MPRPLGAHPRLARIAHAVPEGRERLRGVVRRVETVPERGRRYARGLRVRALRARSPHGTIPGLLSIVVPAHGVEDYIGECLASLRFQEHEDVEIIVVDDASPDASARIARSHARRDPRVRVVSRPNGGPSAARNTGVAHARGEYLAFVDPDDVVSTRGYRVAVETLERTGSDFALLNYDRLSLDQSQPAASWIRRLHSTRRLGCTLETCPDAMINAVPWSKVFRRSFYDAAGLSFPEGALYEDQPWSARAFALAASFDVLPEILVSWRIRRDQSSITQSNWTLPNLLEQVRASEASLAVLDEHASAAIGDIRASQLLAYNMPIFTRNMLRGDREFYEALREAVLELLERGQTASYFHEVPAFSKVLNRLIADDRYDDAAALILSAAQRTNRFRTRRAGDWFEVELPVQGGVEPVNLRLADGEIDLVSRVLRLQLDDHRLTLVGWGFPRNIDLAEHAPEIGLTLLGPRGRRLPLEVTQHVEPRLDLATFHWWCDYRPAGFTASLDLDGVELEPGTWRVEIHVTAGGIERTGILTDVSMAGSAARQASLVRGEHLWTLGRGDDGLCLDVAPAPALATRVSLVGDVLDVAFRAGEVRTVRLIGLAESATDPERTSDGGWRVRIALPNPGGHSAYAVGRLGVQMRDGSEHPLLAPQSLVRFPGTALDEAHRASACRGNDGALEIRRLALSAEDAELSDDEIVVRLRGTIVPGAVIDLVGDRHTLTASLEAVGGPGEGGTTLARFSLRHSAWGRDDLVIPQGSYSLILNRVEPELEVPIRPAASLWDRLPVDTDLSSAQVLTEVSGPHRPRLTFLLRPPLSADERGLRNQRILREEALAERVETDAVFFRSLYGEVTNCNGLGVHQELGRRGATITRFWSIADRSVPVPEGGVGLVEGSRAWHAALTSSRYHMVNVHQLPTFTKSEGQVVIQTMHGYPYKQMGHELWAARSSFFPASQIESYDRRAREWDYFVSPATYATPFLEAAFLTPARSKAEVLEIGYPRNDVLLLPEADAVRSRAREVLGIAPHQTVLLYAPTYRDYLSSDDMTAQRTDFLDARRVVRQLRPDVVVLMRGHAFNARVPGRIAAHPQVIDCSDHPDINELILASDVGILDYSSLRFDYALTDKPMIFLVPDLEQYDAARPGIMPYEPTAPGPLVTTTREVIDLARDVPGLGARYAADRERFRRAYADLDDGRAGARLVDAVFVPRGDAPA